jgi:hypothetical protein
MRFSLMIALALFTLMLLALAGALPDWTRHLGIDIGGLPHGVRELCGESNRSEDLDARIKVLASRLHADHRILTRLIAGDMTLCDAVREVRGLRSESELALLLETLRLVHAGASDEEVLAWHLIDVVTKRFTVLDPPPGPPEQGESVLARLRAEMADISGTAPARAGKKPYRR